jgi:hypothetical protein
VNFAEPTFAYLVDIFETIKIAFIIFQMSAI